MTSRVEPATGAASGGTIRASYEAAGGKTSIARVFECGCLRLRHPRGPSCRGILVNTAGGVVAGDLISLDVELGPRAEVTMTSAAAEKIYRSEGAASTVWARLKLGSESRCTWIPHETILFDQARFRRRFEIELDAGASLFSAEIIVFGRVAHGERDITGSFRDSWRVRRGGRLVYVDESRIEGALGAALAGGAVAGGASSMASVLIAGPEPAAMLDRVREAIEAGQRNIDGDHVEGGASMREGIIIARLIAHAPERLRAVIAAICGAVGSHSVPRDWL